MIQHIVYSHIVRITRLNFLFLHVASMSLPTMPRPLIGPTFEHAAGGPALLCSFRLLLLLFNSLFNDNTELVFLCNHLYEQLVMQLMILNLDEYFYLFQYSQNDTWSTRPSVNTLSNKNIM